MTTTANENLRSTAEELLRVNSKDAKKAAPKLARMLLKDSNRPMLIALVDDYLSRMVTLGIRAKPMTKPEPKKKEKPLIGVPSQADKEGAIAASKAIAASIFERKIRGVGIVKELHVHELRAIAMQLRRKAVDCVKIGYNDALDSVFLVSLSEYCVAADQFARVPDVIPEKVAAQAFEEAKQIAAAALRDGMDKILQNLLARKPPSPLKKPPVIEGETRP